MVHRPQKTVPGQSQQSEFFVDHAPFIPDLLRAAGPLGYNFSVSAPSKDPQEVQAILVLHKLKEISGSYVGVHVQGAYLWEPYGPYLSVQPVSLGTKISIWKPHEHVALEHLILQFGNDSGWTFGVSECREMGRIRRDYCFFPLAAPDEN